MRLTIIGVNNTVGKDNEFRSELDLSGCGLPENFWALQWNERGDNTGHIEYNSSEIQNDLITELPDWAQSCIEVWQAKLDQELAQAEAERLEAERLASEQVAEQENLQNEPQP